MTREEAIKTLKENYCAMCAYGSQDMDSCDIRSCDNKDAIKALEQELCEDAISRQAVDKLFSDAYESKSVNLNEDWKKLIWIREHIKELPPVTPAEKVGRWIETNRCEEWYTYVLECSLCGGEIMWGGKYCPNCGARMEVKND